ncbi:hypothetical protein [Mycolicibacter arupensis]|jgi:hypothetical protein|uniref:Membrane protein n=1 Tax=Mycolicibacter arupensis TaxID=342002 RepID=A0A0F5MZR2_9MYCO|nr:hypothetical protein [Mycolicibacter arupensis]KAA1432305.1 hypothetical protein F0402_04355 [Mycolicibacter arupensis]KKC00289.1 membrane protein [Mycolicibacter arupensis]MCV7276432.1 hypothetical protein [Mycolicibacter arupensis]ORA00686.1 hypothetical protein BST15_02640 [Mycolicibacter arupensis]TXI56515.1 MAG: hypothetical protein E6Q54_10175 [Mycolicibacter arupensis]
MNQWFNLAATCKILVFGLLVGGLLPALFAVGVRINVAGNGVPAVADGTASARRPLMVALSWAIFMLVLAVAVIGVLFIARDFLGHHLGWYLLGAKRG